MAENAPVSVFNPKANPVLWGYLAPQVILWAAKIGFNISEDDVAVILTVTYAAIAWIVRRRVKPLHSDGRPVKVRTKP